MAELSPIPEGFHTATIHLWQHDCRKAVEYYKKVFGAEELIHLRTPDGSAAVHSLIKIGDTIIMMADGWPDTFEHPPHHTRGTTVGVYLYVDDPDALFEKAVKEGAEVLEKMSDGFWGDRYGKFKDPFGHAWTVAARKEEVDEDEMKRRLEAWYQQAKGPRT